MTGDDDWEAQAANLLKAELKRKGITYAELAGLTGDKEYSIRNKLSRGSFTAAFMLRSLRAIGVTHLALDP